MGGGAATAKDNSDNHGRCASWMDGSNKSPAGWLLDWLVEWDNNKRKTENVWLVAGVLTNNPHPIIKKKVNSNSKPKSKRCPEFCFNTSFFCWRGNFGPFFLSQPKVVSKQVQQESQARGSLSASESQGS